MSVVPAPLELLILQPTPFCNIDCTYCYLPGRSTKGRMSDKVIAAACRRAVEAGIVGSRLSVVWHAGEPLVLPISYYENAIRIVAAELPRSTTIEHHFQTNATLIDDAWCHFLALPGIKVGVSIDGPRNLHDRHRRTRTGGGTFERAMTGARRLVEAEVPFHVISVLTREALHYPDEMHDFYAAAGFEHVCFNVEEIEGTNRNSSLADPRCERTFQTFFARFTARMAEDRRIKSLRETDQLSGLIAHRQDGSARHNQQAEPFMILSVAMNGDVSTFSPELLGMTHERFGDFVLGNVLTDSLADIRTRGPFAVIAREIAAGIEHCRETCGYFEVCGGGAPANKLFETGRFDTTETLYCRYTVKLLTDLTLDAVGTRSRHGAEFTA
jgi:uncharacterized protein